MGPETAPDPTDRQQPSSNSPGRVIVSRFEKKRGKNGQKMVKMTKIHQLYGRSSKFGIPANCAHKRPSFGARVEKYSSAFDFSHFSPDFDIFLENYLVSRNQEKRANFLSLN